MSRAEALPATAGSPHGLLTRLRSLRPPVEDRQFWVVQAGVLALAALHDLVLDDLGAQAPAGVPAPTSSGLLLIPVIYAALNFGVRGALGTAIWSTVLIIPNWFVAPEGMAVHLWIEAGYLLILNIVAVVVGQRVESERRARQNAEDALAAAKDARSRYYSLFEDQPAPVIVAGAGEVVAEANTAASNYFGPDIVGRRLQDVLGVGTADLLDETPRCLALPGVAGQTHQLVPTAHAFSTAAGDSQVQVVLADVTEQHRREEEERVYAGRLLTVQEEERRRIARDLHDDPLQSLTYLSRSLDDLGQRPEVSGQPVQQLVEASQVAADAAAALRKIIQGLRPPVLDDLGLVSALRQLALETERRSGLPVAVKVRGDQASLPPDLALAAYRIAQEALNNAVRHAHAGELTVSATFGQSLVLTVCDDGDGVPAKTSEARSRHSGGLGLIGMRERVSLCGGTLTVDERAPHGTNVRAVLPLPGQ